MIRKIIFDDNLNVLQSMPDGAVDLIYIDPPFNTGKLQRRVRIKAQSDPKGERIGFQGKRYRVEKLLSAGFSDIFDDYIEFLRPRLEEAYRVLKPHGSFFLHVDPREVHYCKVLLDQIFGRECFMNEIIWAYDYGGRSKRYWPRKHDNILWYVKDPSNYVFNYEEIDRVPYLAPDLVTREKAARGKTPTDVWWHTIVPTNSREKTGYPTQKPLAIVKRIVKVHSRPGDLVMDFFAGSGTLGEAAVQLGRGFILVDNNPEAIRVMIRRLGKYNPQYINCEAILAALSEEEAVSKESFLF